MLVGCVITHIQMRIWAPFEPVLRAAPRLLNEPEDNWHVDFCVQGPVCIRTR